MKKIIITSLIVTMFPIVSYAGHWQQDNNGWRYKDDDGSYMVGWHQDVDGKWYYLDDQTTYMLTDTTTPDGYSVLADGSWSERSVISLKGEYDNKVEIILSKRDSPIGTREMKYPVTVTIYYNGNYKILDNVNVEIEGIEMSKDGIPYVKYSRDKVYDFQRIPTKNVHTLSDGSTIELNGTIDLYGDGQKGLSLFQPHVESGEPRTVSLDVYVVGDIE